MRMDLAHDVALHIYIYLYVCMCVCVCVYACSNGALMKSLISHHSEVSVLMYCPFPGQKQGEVYICVCMCMRCYVCALHCDYRLWLRWMAYVYMCVCMCVYMFVYAGVKCQLGSHCDVTC